MHANLGECGVLSIMSLSRTYCCGFLFSFVLFIRALNLPEFDLNAKCGPHKIENHEILVAKFMSLAARLSDLATQAVSLHDLLAFGESRCSLTKAKQKAGRTFKLAVNHPDYAEKYRLHKLELMTEHALQTRPDYPPVFASLWENWKIAFDDNERSDIVRVALTQVMSGKRRAGHVSDCGINTVLLLTAERRLRGRLEIWAAEARISLQEYERAVADPDYVSELRVAPPPSLSAFMDGEDPASRRVELETYGPYWAQARTPTFDPETLERIAGAGLSLEAASDPGVSATTAPEDDIFQHHLITERAGELLTYQGYAPQFDAIKVGARTLLDRMRMLPEADIAPDAHLVVAIKGLLGQLRDEYRRINPNPPRATFATSENVHPYHSPVAKVISVLDRLGPEVSPPESSTRSSRPTARIQGQSRETPRRSTASKAARSTSRTTPPARPTDRRVTFVHDEALEVQLPGPKVQSVVHIPEHSTIRTEAPSAPADSTGHADAPEAAADPQTTEPDVYFHSTDIRYRPSGPASSGQQTAAKAQEGPLSLSPPGTTPGPRARVCAISAPQGSGGYDLT